MDICFFCSLNNLFHGSRGLAVSNIFFNGSSEKINILLHKTNLASQRFQSQLSYLFAVNSDPASGYIIESWKQGTDGSLAASGRTYQCNRASCRNGKRNIIKNQSLIITVMEGHVFVGNLSFHIRKRLCIRSIYNIRLCLHYIQKTPEAGKAFLHHFDQLHKNLDRTYKNTDIQSIHGQISGIHFSSGNKKSAKHQCHQVHHSLEETVPAHEIPHTAVVCILGVKKGLVTFAKFSALHIFIGKGLYHTDPCQSILKAGVYITDLSAVIHKGFLHSPVLLHGKHQHDQYQDQKRNCQSPVNKKQENK